MELVILVILCLCGGVFSDGSLRSLPTVTQADKNELLKQHNDYRAGSGASDMLKMVILNFQLTVFEPTSASCTVGSYGLMHHFLWKKCKLGICLYSKDIMARTNNSFPMHHFPSLPDNKKQMGSHQRQVAFFRR